jgi:hypothetical protein
MEFMFHPPHIVEAKAMINAAPTSSHAVFREYIQTYP